MVKSTPPREIWRSSNGIPNCACMLAYPACKHNSEFRRFAAEFRRYLPRNSVELAEFRRYLLRRSSLTDAIGEFPVSVMIPSWCDGDGIDMWWCTIIRIDTKMTSTNIDWHRLDGLVIHVYPSILMSVPPPQNVCGVPRTLSRACGRATVLEYSIPHVM